MVKVFLWLLESRRHPTLLSQSEYFGPKFQVLLVCALSTVNSGCSHTYMRLGRGSSCSLPTASLRVNFSNGVPAGQSSPYVILHPTSGHCTLSIFLFLLISSYSSLRCVVGFRDLLLHMLEIPYLNWRNHFLIPSRCRPNPKSSSSAP